MTADIIGTQDFAYAKGEKHARVLHFTLSKRGVVGKAAETLQFWDGDGSANGIAVGDKIRLVFDMDGKLEDISRIDAKTAPATARTAQ
jgi:hypothetical protein